VDPQNALTFGLGNHQAPVNTEMTEVVTLKNNTKNSIIFNLTAPKSHKYKFEFEPRIATLKPRVYVEVTVKLTVLCTAVFETDVLIMNCKGTEDSPIPECFIALKVNLESALSTSIDYEEIQLQENPIGEGGYGVVFRGTWRGRDVAVKVVKNNEGKDSLAEFLSEVHTLEILRSPYIVSFVGAVKTPGKLALVTEFIAYGSLTSCMTKHRFTMPLKVKCLLDCALGMAYLHENSILHRDLKTENLLVASLDPTAEVNCKITDFGTSRDITNAQQTQAFTAGIGTPAFMAPELLANQKYKWSADVYSFAVICYQVLTEKVPYDEFETL